MVGKLQQQLKLSEEQAMRHDELEKRHAEEKKRFESELKSKEQEILNLKKQVAELLLFKKRTEQKDTIKPSDETNIVKKQTKEQIDIAEKVTPSSVKLNRVKANKNKKPGTSTVSSNLSGEEMDVDPDVPQKSKASEYLKDKPKGTRESDVHTNLMNTWGRKP